MTYPSFNSGEVLTASDMNAVGLWLVKTQTVGSAQTTIEVTGAFSSNYDNYRITYTGGTASAAGGIRFRMGTGASVSNANYYNSVNYTLWASGGPTAVQNNASLGYWQYAGAIDSNSNAFMSIDVFEPYAARSTRFFGAWLQVDSGGNTGGLHRVNTSYTGFTLTFDSGANVSGGTIRVYGYRN